MAGPWEKYQAQPQAKPWEKYGAPPPAPKEGGVDVLDETKRVLSSTNEQIASVLGAPVDAVNWLLSQVDLGSERPIGGSESIAGLMRDMGASGGVEYQPQTWLGRRGSEMLGGAATGALGGAVLGGAGMALGKGMQAIPGLTGAGQATTAASRASIAPVLDAAAGAGGALGGSAAEAVAPGSKWAQLAGTIGGALAGGGIGAALTGPQGATVQAFNRLGIDPTMGTAGVGGKTAALLQNNVLKQMAGSSGKVERALTRTVEQTKAARDTLAKALGSPAGAYGAGETIQTGLRQAFQRVKALVGQQEQQLAAKFSPSETFDARNTLGALQNPVGKIDSDELAKVLADPTIARMRAALESSQGRLTYNDLRRFRTAVGELISPDNMAPGIDQAQLRRLYGALSDDIANAVATKGPDALRQFRNANALYNDARTKYEQHFAKLLGGRTQIAPERAYNLLLGSAEAGPAKANIERFEQVWDALSPKARSELSATVLARMGSRNPEAAGDVADFTIAKFLSDYDRLSPEAKRLLFASNAEARAALDDLLTVAKSFERNVGQTVSTSRSGTGMLQLGQTVLGAGSLASGNPLGVLAATLGPAVGASVMTSPRLTRALARFLEGARTGAPSGAKIGPLLSLIRLFGQGTPTPEEGARP